MNILSSYIDNFKNVKVLCVGDIMLDRFMYGSVNRISPEAPVPVFLFNSEKKMLGGCGNVVANLAALGCNISLVSVIGDDINGKEVSSLLEKLKCESHMLKIDKCHTIVKTRFVAGHNHLLRADYEDKFSLIGDYDDKLMKMVTIAIKDADIVLISDYNKGVINEELTPKVIELCRKLKKQVIVDPKGKNYEKYRGATLIKFNLKEFSEATDMSFNPTSPKFVEDVKFASKKIFRTYEIPNIIVTLSEHGMIYASAENHDEIFQIPTEAREVFDVSGAGDTSLAALGAAIASEATMKDAMRLANVASGIVVGKLGTATVTADELKDALAKDNNFDGCRQERKIVNLDKAVKLAQQYKKEGKVVGFTNGCFDLLHMGHLHSLMEAKKNCDLLFVGVNTDNSVKRYKGDTRPIQDEKTRSMLLASLEFVDCVVVFDDDTAINLVDKIRPDVIAKEGYTIDKWPEAQKVVSYGGKAITLQRVDGYSTTSLVSKMKG